MKKWILWIGFIFTVNQIYAQYFNFTSSDENLSKYNVIDSAYLKCSYKLTYLKDPFKPEDKSTDLQILLIGKEISKYYSQYALDYNHYVMKEVKKGAETVSNIKESGAWSYQLFKDYSQGKETVTDIASMLRGNYIYKEDFPLFDWKINDEKQTILSYTCQKATVSFRGRNFIAWFAADIPIPNGPWKFGGLPGLILKLSDSENNFIYECQGIERLKEKELIKFYKVDYTKVSRKELDKLYRRFHDDFAAYQFATTGRGMYVVDPKTKKSTYIEHSFRKIPYNPIELE